MRRVIFILSCVAAVCLGATLNANAYDVAVNPDDTQDPDLLKPKIEYVNIDSIKYEDNGYSYDVFYTIKWKCSRNMGVGVGTYSDNELTIYPIIQADYSRFEYIENGIPYYIVSQNTGAIPTDCNSEICFLVGDDRYVIYFDKGGILASKDMLEEDIEDIMGEETFEVYDCAGQRVGVFQNRDDIRGNSPKGLLIIRHMCDNVVVSTEKLLNK